MQDRRVDHGDPVWALPPDQVLTALGSSPDGLSEEEVSRRLADLGPNRLAEGRSRPEWLLFLDQFRSMLILVLIGAALLAGIIGDPKDAAVILAVVVLNACLGYWQEHRAAATLAGLRRLLPQTAKRRRGGEIREAAADDLVPGDIVLLAAGDRVPADGRVVAAHLAAVDQSVLTGESLPVDKEAEAGPPGAPLAERAAMVYMNSVVVRGRLEVAVTATGMATEFGRLVGLLQAAEPTATPLQRRLDRLGHRLGLIAAATVAIIFVLALLRAEPLLDAVVTSIALAVAAIPEGLPAVITVTLATGMHRMARKRAIVKKLAAVETLGCTTVICSDKTGTLTLNQMTAREIVYLGRRFTVSGRGYGTEGAIACPDGAALPDFTALLRPVVLCNDSRIAAGEVIGDPTEGALLALAAKAGIDWEAAAAGGRRLADLPFGSAHKFMATFHPAGSSVELMVKGAPDVLLAGTARYLATDGERPLDGAARAVFVAENERLAAQGMRVLGVAGRRVPAARFTATDDLMALASEDLTMIGLIGLADPPRPEVQEAIALCRQAGIGIKMITGDHPVTAAAIARELDLPGEVLTGVELDGSSPAELAGRIARTAVFARTAPEHKVKIVQGLQALGHVVAMTGDGVNDAPALKMADIGIAMGRGGTDVAKDAAAMVLTDDNFATIVGAVREGRTIYDNIVRFVHFQLSTNIGAVLSVLATQLMDLPAPFTAIQILWINMIMDGPPAMTLGLEPPRRGLMEEPPRPRAAEILPASRVAWLLAAGATMMAGTVATFLAGLSAGGLAHARTLAFTTFVLFQVFNLFNVRAEHGSAFDRRMLGNAKLWLALALVLGLQLPVVHWPAMQGIFATVALSPAEWAMAAAVASSVLLLDEGRKLLMRALPAAKRKRPIS